MARLIGFIVIFALFLTFIVLNLGIEYRSDVHLGFYKFTEIPIFITVFISMFLGMLFSFPFVASLLKKKNGSQKTTKPDSKSKKKQEMIEEIPGENGPYGIN